LFLELVVCSDIHQHQYLANQLMQFCSVPPRLRCLLIANYLKDLSTITSQDHLALDLSVMLSMATQTLRPPLTVGSHFFISLIFNAISSLSDRLSQTTGHPQRASDRNRHIRSMWEPPSQSFDACSQHLGASEKRAYEKARLSMVRFLQASRGV